MSEETMTEFAVEEVVPEPVVLDEPAVTEEVATSSISIEEYEAARAVLIEAGQDTPHEIDVIAVAVEAQQADTISEPTSV